MSLVPDYDNSDTNSDDISDTSNGSDNDEQFERIIDVKKEQLPSATRLLSGKAVSSGTVFNNPFQDAEKAKIASLEKHVKMVRKDATVKTINGKKICWNFRKGRCRFGSKCTYAHDSDLQVPENQVVLLEEVKQQSENTLETTSSLAAKDNDRSRRKNKRPGLGDSIIPTKKVLNMYSALNKV